MAQSHDMKIVAYEAWLSCGQNITETVRLLKADQNFTVSRQTLTEWRGKYDWLQRAARAEAEQDSQTDGLGDDALIAVMLIQKKKYEGYFEALPAGQVDNQAVYAYSNILKTIVDLRPKEQNTADIDRPKLFLEDIEFIAGVLKELDPEGLKVFGRNFDVIVARFKEDHEKTA